MSTLRKSLTFLGIAFLFSWGALIGAFALTLNRTVPPAVILTIMMAGPAIAAIACTFLFEKGRRLDALGLRFTPNIWWLWAWLIPIAIAIISVIATLVLSDRTYVDAGAATIAAVETQSPDQAAQMRDIPQLGLVIILAAAILGAAINTPILTLTEELGWRGYLHDLWRPFGFWRATIGTGVVWGLWHAPAIVLYGLNYPTHPWPGVALFTLYCVLISPALTLVRERGGSVWAAGIFHGAFNAVGGLTLITLSDPSFPWNGIVGVGGFVAAALAFAGVAAHRRGLAREASGA